MEIRIQARQIVAQTLTDPLPQILLLQLIALPDLQTAPTTLATVTQDLLITIVVLPTATAIPDLQTTQAALPATIQDLPPAVQAALPATQDPQTALHQVVLAAEAATTHTPDLQVAQAAIPDQAVQEVLTQEAAVHLEAAIQAEAVQEAACPEDKFRIQNSIPKSISFEVLFFFSPLTNLHIEIINTFAS